MRINRLCGITAIVAALAVAALGLAPRDDAAGGPTPVSSGISALTLAPVARDLQKLSGHLLGYGVVDPGAVRALGSFDGASWYIAPGRDEGLCLLHTGAVPGGVCEPHELPYRGGLWLATEGADGRQLIAMLVPDGYTTAVVSGPDVAPATTAIKTNVMFMAHQGDRSVAITGPGLAPRIYSVPDLLTRLRERLAKSGR